MRDQGTGGSRGRFRSVAVGATRRPRLNGLRFPELGRGLSLRQSMRNADDGEDKPEQGKQSGVRANLIGPVRAGKRAEDAAERERDGCLRLQVTAPGVDQHAGQRRQQQDDQRRPLRQMGRQMKQIDFGGNQQDPAQFHDPADKADQGRDWKAQR